MASAERVTPLGDDGVGSLSGDACRSLLDLLAAGMLLRTENLKSEYREKNNRARIETEILHQFVVCLGHELSVIEIKRDKPKKYAENWKFGSKNMVETLLTM